MNNVASWLTAAAMLEISVLSIYILEAPVLKSLADGATWKHIRQLEGGGCNLAAFDDSFSTDPTQKSSL